MAVRGHWVTAARTILKVHVAHVTNVMIACAVDWNPICATLPELKVAHVVGLGVKVLLEEELL
jgi:hypothetical protein